jgi:hypothetical protein
MQFQPIAHLSLPQLAWVAIVNRKSGLVTLEHGLHVEVRQKFFVEGVWSGPFENGDFSETDCVFGTGGIIINETIRFVPSASTVDYLYYAEDGAAVTVSNSLPLLLARIEDELDPRCLDYPAICHSIIDGIDDYRRDIPTKKGKVRRQMYRNLNISRDSVFESEKRIPPRFECFNDYYTYLRENYALIAANARDEARTQRLEIWSTQSKGYDSTAVNAIASRFGIDKVFTLPEAKNVFYLAHNEVAKLPDDDGSEICDLLGVTSVRINRRAFAENFGEEYLYYCGLHHNQDFNLQEISKHISRVGVLLTGTLGEIWYTKSCLGSRAYLDTSIKRWDLGGHGMAELRLVIGFIHLPLPYIGARRREDIVEVTESAEMDPWRLGNAYDRPIPRRIAEEAGIPRSMFGQSKMGSVVIFAPPSIPYGKGLRKQLFKYLAQEKVMGGYKALFWPVVREVNSVLMLKSERRYALVYYAERLISKVIGREFHFQLLWSHIEGASFCFCVNKTASSYAKKLAQLRLSSARLKGRLILFIITASLYTFAHCRKRRLSRPRLAS